ncbi:MAG: hypothetical protein NHB36_00195 [Nitrospira sp.]|nr:hypothetical protein [Nitrospira sp.]
MWRKRLPGVASLLTSVAAMAHPGHPALGPQHTHAWLGIDPLYVLVLLAPIGIAAWAWRRRAPQRARERARR